MIVLGIETATIEVGVGLSQDGVPIASLVARPGRQHVETLHPAIEAVMSAGHKKLADIDAIAVDVGPGLFTSLRVGIAAAKALSFGLSIPVIGVHSTEVLRVATEPSTAPVIPVIDMRRGELAWELPGPDQEIQLGAPSVLALQLASLEGEYVLVGDGARRSYNEIVGHDAQRFRLGSVIHDAPPVVSLVELATSRLTEGESIDAHALLPLYLREADAKINFATRTDVHNEQLAVK